MNPALGLHRAAHHHRLTLDGAGDLDLLALGQVAQGEVGGPVDHQAHGPAVAVLDHQDDRPVEVRIAELRHGDQKAWGEALHGGQHFPPRPPSATGPPSRPPSVAGKTRNAAAPWLQWSA